MRQFSLIFAIVVVFSLVSYARGADADERKAKGDLVGKWKLKSSDEELPPGMVVEFTKGGKIIITGLMQGKTVSTKGTYKRDGKKLTMTGKTPSGKEQTETRTIKSLTAKELVLVDFDGKKATFERK
jgi:uncharacterized protein (TIGR03066 family)